jgi:hypothetical protein
MRTRLFIIALLLCIVCLVCGALPSFPFNSLKRSAPPQMSFAARPLPRLALPHAPHLGATTPPGDFPFQTATSSDGLVIIHYYQQSSSFAQDALTTIEGDVRHPVEDTLGMLLQRPVNVYIYNSRDDFLKGAQPGNADETAAYADPSHSAIYLPIINSDMHSDDANAFLPHELTHIVFHQNVDVGHLADTVFRSFPLWLDEGLAEYDVPATTTYGQGDAALLAQVVGQDALKDFYQIFRYNYPTDAFTDSLCYAEARAFIDYLITIYGPTKFHQFLRGLRQGEILLAAEQTFGVDLQTLQSQWRVALGLPPLPHDAGNGLPATTPIPYVAGQVAPIVSQTRPFALAGQDQFSGDAIRITFLLTLLMLIAIVAGWFQILQRRHRMAAVRAAEDLLAASASLGGARLLPSATPTTTRARRERPLPQVLWPEMMAFALLAPLVLLVEVFGGQLNPALEWSQSFHIAAIVAAVGCVVLLGLTVLAGVAGRLSSAHVGGMVLAVGILASAILQGNAAGIAQSQAYLAKGADALAVQVLQHAGVGGIPLAEAQAEWGFAALNAHDYATATTHLEAAIVASSDDTHQAMWRAALNQSVTAWSQALTAAQQFAQAMQVANDQEHASACDVTCQTAIVRADGAVALAQGTLAILQGQAAAGLAIIAAAPQQFPNADITVAVKEIQAGLAHPFAAGLAASNAGDTLAMNVLFAIAATKQPQSATTAQASEVPQPVSGIVRDDSGTAVTGDTVFFLGFANPNAAQLFVASSFQDDGSLTKADATLGANGAFSVRLEPGYWYLPLWDDPTQAHNNYINVAMGSTLGVFQVAAYQPTVAGVITGY